MAIDAGVFAGVLIACIVVTSIISVVVTWIIFKRRYSASAAAEHKSDPVYDMPPIVEMHKNPYFEPTGEEVHNQGNFDADESSFDETSFNSDINQLENVIVYKNRNTSASYGNVQEFDRPPPPTTDGHEESILPSNNVKHYSEQEAQLSKHRPNSYDNKLQNHSPAVNSGKALQSVSSPRHGNYPHPAQQPQQLFETPKTSQQSSPPSSQDMTNNRRESNERSDAFYDGDNIVQVEKDEENLPLPPGDLYTPVYDTPSDEYLYEKYEHTSEKPALPKNPPPLKPKIRIRKKG